LRKKGEGTVVSLTGCRRGQRRDRNDRALVGNNLRRRRSVRAALGRGEKRREAGRGPVKPDGGAHLL
jgi:stalled ribosome alternative rescue factor ArfA